MTREEEIQKAIEEEFEDHLFEDESDYIMQSSKFKKGIKWSDEHPRKGLWDAEKVIDYIYNHAHVRTFGDIVIDDMSVTEFIEAMKKAMEE